MSTTPRDAADAVFDAFASHRIVGGFSAGHGNKEVDDFLLDLVRDPRFPAHVDDIVIECGNSLYQDVLDRYVAGDDVTIDEVQVVWRNTTQRLQCGFNTFYIQLIPLVRRLNERRSDDEQLRVLAADPPIDWGAVDSADDLQPFEFREGVIADVVERDVLKRGRTALMLFGIHHMQHGVGIDTAVQLYEDRGYEGVTYAIADHIGFDNQAVADIDNDALEARMADWPTPSIVEIAGTWLAELDSAAFNEPPGMPGFPGVDAYLYVGPRDLLLREPPSAQAMLDETYIAELTAAFVSTGEPTGSPSDPQTALDRERQAGVFAFELR